MAHDEPPHQDLRCWKILLFACLVVKELSMKFFITSGLVLITMFPRRLNRLLGPRLSISADLMRRSAQGCQGTEISAFIDDIVPTFALGRFSFAVSRNRP